MKSGFCVSLKELKTLIRYLEKFDKKPMDFVDLSGTEICRLTCKPRDHGKCDSTGIHQYRDDRSTLR